MKPGYKTTEFWLTIAVNVADILAVIAGILDPKTAGIVMSIVNGIYAISRGLAKHQQAVAK